MIKKMALDYKDMVFSFSFLQLYVIPIPSLHSTSSHGPPVSALVVVAHARVTTSMFYENWIIKYNTTHVKVSLYMSQKGPTWFNSENGIYR